MKTKFRFYNINRDMVITTKRYKRKTLISVDFLILKDNNKEYLYKIKEIVGNVVFVEDTNYWLYKQEEEQANEEMK